MTFNQWAAGRLGQAHPALRTVLAEVWESMNGPNAETVRIMNELIDEFDVRLQREFEKGQRW